MRLIDADAFSEQYGNYYAEEGPAEGFIGTVGDLIAKQPTIEAEPVRHGWWIDNGEDKYICSACKGYVYHWFGKSDFCSDCGARMDGGADNDSTRID